MGKSSTVIKREKATFLKAMEESLGIVSDAAKLCDISPSNHYDWMKSDEEYVKRIDAIGELVKDFGESALHKNVKKGKERSVYFFLERRARDRGYGKTLDLTTKGDKLGEELDYSNLSEEELMQLQEIHKKLRK